MGIRIPFNPMGGSFTLPPGARAVKYLQTDGNSWIDTGMTDGLNRKLIIDCSVSKINDESMIGIRSTFEMLHFYQGICLEFFGMYWTYNVLNVNTRYVIETEITNGTSVSCKLNGSLLGIKTGIATITNMNMFVFASNKNNVAERPALAGTRLYSLRLYADSVLIRDFIPVSVGGIACLYDKVSKSYFYNSGIGSFIAGPYV